MAFPFSYEFTITVKSDVAPKDLIEKVENDLHSWRASEINVEENQVRFTGGMFRMVGSWNMLVAVSSGEIKVLRYGNEVNLTTNLKFTTMLVFVTVGMLGWMGPFIFKIPSLGFAGKALIICFGWMWLFGMNYLTTVMRFRKWAKKLFNDESLKPSRSEKFFGLPKWGIGSSNNEEFEPKWQPNWLRVIPWKRKLPVMFYLVLLIWNVTMLTVFGGGNFFQSFGDLPILARFTFASLTVLTLLVAPFSIGRSIDNWNQRVSKRRIKTDGQK